MEIQLHASDTASGRNTAGEILTQAVRGYIESRYREKFSLKKMAGELFVNGCYLLRVFRKHTGFTPLAYHHHIRCEHAKEMLLCTLDPISEIGKAVGFASPAHFTHIFKKLEGCTPTEYRNNRKGQDQLDN